MTDRQLLDVLLKRAAVAGKQHCEQWKNPKLVLTQQYGKKLYFALKFEGASMPALIGFAKNGFSRVFLLPELPERLMDWKQETIHKIVNAKEYAFYTDFDIDKEPKEVVHVFFSGVISALNTPGMSTGLMSVNRNLFGPNETYEEIQVEADLGMFGQNSFFG